MASTNFRAGVVAVITDGDEVMAFERADSPGAWQLPQGGIDIGETPVEAAWRELDEETGLGPDEVELVAEHPEWTVYEWPPEIRAQGRHGIARDGKRLGQAQRWFFFRLRDPGIAPVPDGVEFVAWKWTARSQLVEQVVDFRRDTYRRVLLGG